MGGVHGGSGFMSMWVNNVHAWPGPRRGKCCAAEHVGAGNSQDQAHHGQSAVGCIVADAAPGGPVPVADGEKAVEMAQMGNKVQVDGRCGDSICCWC